MERRGQEARKTFKQAGRLGLRVHYMRPAAELERRTRETYWTRDSKGVLTVNRGVHNRLFGDHQLFSMVNEATMPNRFELRVKLKYGGAHVVRLPGHPDGAGMTTLFGERPSQANEALLNVYTKEALRQGQRSSRLNVFFPSPRERSTHP